MTQVTVQMRDPLVQADHRGRSVLKGKKGPKVAASLVAAGSLGGGEIPVLRAMILLVALHQLSLNIQLAILRMALIPRHHNLAITSAHSGAQID